MPPTRRITQIIGDVVIPNPPGATETITPDTPKSSEIDIAKIIDIEAKKITDIKLKENLKLIELAKTKKDVIQVYSHFVRDILIENNRVLKAMESDTPSAMPLKSFPGWFCIYNEKVDSYIICKPTKLIIDRIRILIKREAPTDEDKKLWGKVCLFDLLDKYKVKQRGYIAISTVPVVGNKIRITGFTFWKEIIDNGGFEKQQEVPDEYQGRWGSRVFYTNKFYHYHSGTGAFASDCTGDVNILEYYEHEEQLNTLLNDAGRALRIINTESMCMSNPPGLTNIDTIIKEYYKIPNETLKGMLLKSWDQQIKQSQ